MSMRCDGYFEASINGSLGDVSLSIPDAMESGRKEEPHVFGRKVEIGCGLKVDKQRFSLYTPFG